MSQILNQQMYELGAQRSVIREIFEYGKKRKALVGEENVFDFSLGNPNVLPPKEINKSIIKSLDISSIHGYTSAQGNLDVRESVAKYLTEKLLLENINPSTIYMTGGAAAALAISLKAIINPGDEVIIFAPFFPEYKVFIENAGGKVKIAHYDVENNWIDFDELEKLITKDTKAIIVNSPNNPSGLIIDEKNLKKLSKLLIKKNEEFNSIIFLISDEPYREIILENEIELPLPYAYYENTIIVYSYSKSFSLPGSRIGYIAISSNSPKGLYEAIAGAGRSLGNVCASSLFQVVIKENIYTKPNIEEYRENFNILFNGLKDIGFSMVKPQGSFYLLIKAPNGDANDFYKKCAEEDILLVPCDSFGLPGYVRVAFCVSKQTITNSLNAFKKVLLKYN